MRIAVFISRLPFYVCHFTIARVIADCRFTIADLHIHLKKIFRFHFFGKIFMAGKFGSIVYLLVTLYRSYST